MPLSLRLLRPLQSLALAGLLGAGVSACGGVETEEDPLGAAHQAQIDPGNKDYVIYTLESGSGAQIGSVLVTATAGDGYAANREYWYLTRNLTNDSSVTFIGGTSQSWSTPPSGLGTLAFTMNRTPTWTSGTMAGTLPTYSNTLTGERDAINWKMTNSGGVWRGTITWWHDSTGNIFGPGVTRTLTPTSTSGSAYYYAQSPL